MHEDRRRGTLSLNQNRQTTMFLLSTIAGANSVLTGFLLIAGAACLWLLLQEVRADLRRHWREMRDQAKEKPDQP